jgi:hypothetical protein
VIDLLGGRLLGRVPRLRRAKNLYQMLRHFLPKQGSAGFKPHHRELLLESYAGSAAEAVRWARRLKRVGRLKGRKL